MSCIQFRIKTFILRGAACADHFLPFPMHSLIPPIISKLHTANIQGFKLEKAEMTSNETKDRYNYRKYVAS